jgi:hypothetical protein
MGKKLQCRIVNRCSTNNLGFALQKIANLLCYQQTENTNNGLKELNPRRRVYVEIPKPVRVELNASGFDYILAPPVILATPERVLVSQHRPDAEGLISIPKCLKLTTDIIFQSHFIAHLARSNARDHTNPDSGPATTSQAIRCIHRSRNLMLSSNAKKKKHNFKKKTFHK